MRLCKTAYRSHTYNGTSQEDYVESEEERFQMEQGAGTSKGQQTQESAPGPEEANAAWSEWNKSD